MSETCERCGGVEYVVICNACHTRWRPMQGESDMSHMDEMLQEAAHVVERIQSVAYDEGYQAGAAAERRNAECTKAELAAKEEKMRAEADYANADLQHAQTVGEQREQQARLHVISQHINALDSEALGLIEQQVQFYRRRLLGSELR